jgi:hypothetical protein
VTEFALISANYLQTQFSASLSLYYLILFILKELFSKPQLAEAFLEAYILPVFKDPNELEKSLKRARSLQKPDAIDCESDNQTDLLFNLAKVLLISGNHEPQLEQLIETISKSLPAQFLKQFLQLFLKDKPFLVKHKSACLREAFLTRQRVIEAKLQRNPRFDWSMADAKFENADIEAFLKSKEESKIFDSDFKDLRSAGAFAKRSTIHTDRYSVNFICYKQDRKVKISVTKTINDIQIQMANQSTEACQRELRSIRAFLNLV